MKSLARANSIRGFAGIEFELNAAHNVIDIDFD